MLTFGSFFSGIGGLDLGLERAGMVCKFQVEIDPFCRQVLHKHWPDVPKYGDIKELRGDELEPVDLFCGGPPCQPHSLDGDRKASEDERDLWPDYFRIIQRVKPRWVLVENVPGLLSSENGRFFGRILRDLAECRYDAEWDCISADSVGLPHKRERVVLIAYPHAERLERRVFTGPRLRAKTFHEAEVWRHIPPPYVLPPPYGVSARLAEIGTPGNAVVPQVAELIGRMILVAEELA